MVELGVAQASDRCAVAYTVWVESDDVEIGLLLGAEMRRLTGLDGIALEPVRPDWRSPMARSMRDIERFLRSWTSSWEP